MGMSTAKAFEKMINTRAIHRKLGIDSQQVRNYRNVLKTGLTNISLDKKIELLEKAGYMVLQEMEWELKKK